jgi:hypothetical protein
MPEVIIKDVNTGKTIIVSDLDKAIKEMQKQAEKDKQKKTQ